MPARARCSSCRPTPRLRSPMRLARVTPRGRGATRSMPALAIDWSHRLMRIMLKYREVAPLGDAASGLLDFAQRTRTLDVLLRDPDRAGLVLVTLDEPVVRAETSRLVSEVRARGVDIA